MKIVHISQYYNDNMGYQENILPKYQARLGHKVIILTSNLSSGFNTIRINQLGDHIEENFLVKRIDIRGEFIDRFVIFKNLYKYLEELKPDYIFHHNLCCPSIVTVSKYKKNNPKLFLAVDNHLDLNIAARNKLWRVGYYNIFWSNFIKKYDKYIDLYFGVTATRCLFLKEELDIDNNKIRLLPIGADTIKSHVNISKNNIFNKYHIDTNKFILVHGGKITKEKQIDRILKAFKDIDNENIEFILFGKIEDKAVAKLVKDDKRIKYIGWLNRDETLALLKYSDLGIWNTQHTTLLEDSVAVGLPIIIRYYGSTSHLIDDSGLFLYDGSIREIYDKLNFIINNKDILNKFKKNAIRMSKVLSYENIAKESLSYIEDKSAKVIHNKFMNERYSCVNYKYFRVINRE